MVVRVPAAEIQEATCTDMAQQWGKVRNDVKKMYEAVPVSQFCHFKKKEKNTFYRIKDEIDCDIPGLLIKDLPNSELFKTISGYRSNHTEIIINDGTLLEDIEKLLNHNLQFPSAATNLSVEEKEFYESKVALSIQKAVTLCYDTRFQNNNLWLQERKMRITASDAYSFVTYSRNKNAIWDKKISAHLNSSFQGNTDTKHGLQCEKAAVKAYEDLLKVKVTHMGLLVNPMVPWLGFSPDGIVVNQNMIEVKSPKIGKQKTASEAVTELPFMETVNGITVLKERHKYFCQVQLGMFITGLKSCHFIIYCSFDSSMYVVNIPFNETKVQTEYLPSLINVYFTHFLRLLTQREKENNCDSNKNYASLSDKSDFTLLKKSVK